MPGYAFPTIAHNNRAVTPREYEDLASPQAPDGVIGPPGVALVYANSTLLGVRIRANRAVMIRGLRWESGDTEVSVPVDPNTTPNTTRRDLVVLRMTRNPWNAAPAVVKGTPAAVPITPSPTYGTDTSTGVWELPLAEVSVPYNDTLTDAAQCVTRAWYVGEDGQLICTSDASRPPHERGRRIFETHTGRAWISTGSEWLITAEDSGNLGLSFYDPNGVPLGWSAQVNTVRRRNGWVYLGMSPQRTGEAVPANTYVPMGTLPAGFRPPVTVEALAYAQTSGAGRITIDPVTGIVQVYMYGGLATSRYVNVQPVTYPAAL